MKTPKPKTQNKGSQTFKQKDGQHRWAFDFWGSVSLELGLLTLIWPGFTRPQLWGCAKIQGCQPLAGSPDLSHRGLGDSIVLALLGIIINVVITVTISSIMIIIMITTAAASSSTTSTSPTTTTTTPPAAAAAAAASTARLLFMLLLPILDFLALVTMDHSTDHRTGILVG